MKNRSSIILQTILHASAWLPFFVLVWNALNHQLSANPIQTAIRFSGQTAVFLLILSLAISPLHTLCQYSPLLSLRKPLGLYSFMYASLHLFIFAVLDYGLNVNLLFQTSSGNSFILLGMMAFILLLVMATTSVSRKTLWGSSSWRWIKYLSYPVILLVILHFALARKGSLWTLQGDVFQPLVYGVTVIILLVLRLPIVRKRLQGILCHK